MQADGDQSYDDEDNTGAPADCPVPVCTEDDAALSCTDCDAFELVSPAGIACVDLKSLGNTSDNKDCSDQNIRSPCLDQIHVTLLGLGNLGCGEPCAVPVLLAVECPNFLGNQEALLGCEHNDEQRDDSCQQGNKFRTDECSDQQIEYVKDQCYINDVRDNRDDFAEFSVLAIEFADKADADDHDDGSADRKRKSRPEGQSHFPCIRIAAEAGNSILNCCKCGVGRCTYRAETYRYGVVDQGHHCSAKRREADGDQEGACQSGGCTESCSAFNECTEDESDDNRLQSCVRSNTLEHTVDCGHCT